MGTTIRSTVIVLTVSTVLAVLVSGTVVTTVLQPHHYSVHTVNSTASVVSPTSMENSRSISSTQVTANHSSSSTSDTPSSYLDGRAYLNVSKVYASLGYPKITYDDYYTPYLRSKPNFTMNEGATPVGVHVGDIQAAVIGLDEAVRLAAEYAKLDPANYVLGEAVFMPGVVFNSTLIGNPEWFLYFAEINDGYWVYDSYGPQSLSLEIDVNALSGAVQIVGGGIADLSNSGHYEIKVNSSFALETVRASNIPGVLPALTENGTVGFMEPRMVFRDSGQRMLSWIIQLGYSSGYSELQGTFTVDAETGELVGGSSGVAIGHPPAGLVESSLAFSTAKNLAVSQQTFQIDGSIIGRSGSIPVTVSNVLVVKPGSRASIQLNFSAMNRQNDPDVTLSFANPLPGFQNLSPDGFPPGVSFQFTSSTLALPRNSSANTTLLIVVDRNAPSGTYLIEVKGTYLTEPGNGETYLFFFLSVWDGSGQWPPPPIIK